MIFAIIPFRLLTDRPALRRRDGGQTIRIFSHDYYGGETEQAGARLAVAYDLSGDGRVLSPRRGRGRGVSRSLGS